MEEISKRSNLVTFSSGAGSSGDVIFLYTCDICGKVEKQPRHARVYGNLRPLIQAMQDERIRALSTFRSEVREGKFPRPDTTPKISEEELAAFFNGLP